MTQPTNFQFPPELFKGRPTVKNPSETQFEECKLQYLEAWGSTEPSRPADVLAQAQPQRDTAAEITVKDPHTTTVRNDGGKVRVDLLPVIPLMRISEVLTVALKKYSDRNWEPGMAWSRCYASALRHLLMWWSGETCDKETGLSHLAHCACNILFLLEYEHTKRGTDDRPV